MLKERNDFGLIDTFNGIFGHTDTIFKELGHRNKIGNLIPNLPGIKTYYREQGVIADEEKTVHYENGKVSRLDGPAIIYHDDREDEWWIEGKQVTEKEVNDYREKMEMEKDHRIIIDGKMVKVKGDKYKKIKELLE